MKLKIMRGANRKCDEVDVMQSQSVRRSSFRSLRTTNHFDALARAEAARGRKK